MIIPEDILIYIDQHFPAAKREEVIALLKLAVLHDGTAPAPRIIRSAVYASTGDIEKLLYYIDLIAIDYRDVIVAGEYEDLDGELIRVRDLSLPFLLNNS